MGKRLQSNETVIKPKTVLTLNIKDMRQRRAKKVTHTVTFRMNGEMDISQSLYNELIGYAFMFVKDSQTEDRHIIPVEIDPNSSATWEVVQEDKTTYQIGGAAIEMILLSDTEESEATFAVGALKKYIGSNRKRIKSYKIKEAI